MNEPVVAVALLMALLVAGEVVSIISRARVPMLLIVMLGYLILVWTGLFPKEILDTASLGTFGALMIAPLIIHMGTIVPFNILKGQVKAIAIALSGMLVATLLLILIVSPLFGYPTAVASAGPLTGGIIAFVVTTGKLEALGMTSLIAIPALILAIQKLVGMPLAAKFLIRYANKVKKTINDDTYNQVAATKELHEDETEGEKSWLPKKYQTNTILLFQLFLGSVLAIFLGKITGVSYSVWALVIGIIGLYLKFYQPKVMERSNSFGIAMVGLIIYIMGSLNDITPSMFANSLFKVVVIMVIGIVGLIVGGYIASKLFKWDVNKGIAVTLTALFGFPGDYILCEEVSRSVGETEKERGLIFDEILIPMLVGGFTTVTTASIVVASVLVNTL